MSVVPQHVAIIMDGSGRWALKNGMQRMEGHAAGVDALKQTVEAAIEHHVKYLTVYAMSRDNMKRPQKEVTALLRLFCQNIKCQTEQLVEQGVRLQFMGDISMLDKELQDLAAWAEQQTRLGDQLVFTVAVNYSGQWHMVDGIKRLMQDHASASDERISQYLEALLPSRPDLLIRTGGEKRLSDFMMYHLSYTELLFIDQYWPDFSRDDFRWCLEQYAKRDRRFGQVKESSC